jgi:hypothetical protein
MEGKRIKFKTIYSLLYVKKIGFAIKIIRAGHRIVGYRLSLVKLDR